MQSNAMKTKNSVTLISVPPSLPPTVSHPFSVLHVWIAQRIALRTPCDIPGIRPLVCRRRTTLLWVLYVDIAYHKLSIIHFGCILLVPTIRIVFVVYASFFVRFDFFFQTLIQQRFTCCLCQMQVNSVQPIHAWHISIRHTM